MASKKRALVVVHSYYLRDTRPRRHSTALADAGWDVDVVCARDAGESPLETVAGVRIHRLPARRRRGSKGRYLFEYLSFTVMAFFAVTWLWLRKRQRAIYVVGIPNFLVFAAILPRVAGARVLLDMRDPFPEFLRARYDLSPSHPLVRAALLEEKLSCRFATGIVTVTPLAKSLHKRSVKPERVTVVVNAPDPRLFDAEPRARNELTGRTMIYAGTVGRRHGLDVAVEAVARLRDEVPNLRLTIVGDGDAVPALRALARAEGIEDRVVFEEPQPLERMPAIMREAWLGVQPNRPDPFMELLLPIKVLEWCWLRIPVACGETQPLRALFADNELLFHTPGDLEGLCKQILAAHADPDALARRVERARAAAERFRYEDQIAALLEAVGR